MKEDKKLMRKILVQTETVTISAQTKQEITEKEAIDDIVKYIIHPNVEYRNYVVLPICTEEQWKGGNVNFCPRCGYRLTEWEEEEIQDEYRSECPECYAVLDISIRVNDDGDDV